MDTVTKEKRSEIMSRIRGKWTGPERFAHNFLKGNRVRHRMHPKVIGSPDILLRDNNTVIFIDGCFWHGCPEHYRRPKTNKKFWLEKITRNMERDRKVMGEICEKTEFRPVRIWECRLSSAFLLAAAEAR